MRRYLIEPASMIWPRALVNTSFLYALHDHRESDPAKTNGWSISRYRYFFYVFIGSFVWYVLNLLEFPLTLGLRSRISTLRKCSDSVVLEVLLLLQIFSPFSNADSNNLNRYWFPGYSMYLKSREKKRTNSPFSCKIPERLRICHVDQAK